MRLRSRASAALLLLAALVILGAAVVPALHGSPDRSASSRSPVRPDSSPGPGPQPLAATESLALTASTGNANPKDSVLFALWYNNTGDQAAPDVWINVTASSGFVFAGDTAAGNVSGYPRYHFTSVGLGLHEFQMTFTVAVGTSPGSTLSVTATMVYSDGTGLQHFLGPVRASVVIGIVSKQLYLGWAVVPPGILTPAAPTGGLVSQGTFTLTKGGPASNFDLEPVLATSFRAVNVTAVLYVQPLSTPASLDMNLTLIDVNGAATTAVASVEQVNTVTGPGYWTFFYSFPSLNYLFSSGHQIRLQVLNTANSGASALLATNATAEPSRIIVQTSTYVTVKSLSPGTSPPTYLSPKSTLVIAANVSDPFGSAEIVDARLNVTGPSGPLVTWLSLNPPAIVDPASPSAWKLFRYTRAPLLANGSYTIELTAIERNGAVDVAGGSFTVRAPSFTFTKMASVPQAKSGTRYTYTLWYNNTGTGPAGTVWINDTLPSSLVFVSSVPGFSTNTGSTYGWTLNAISVGSHSVQITVQVKGGTSGVAYLRNWASLDYSDERGFLWPSQMSHADVVLNGPVLTLLVTSVPSQLAHSNETVVFAFNLTNSGDAANKIWLNDTLPSGLTYVSDTSSSLGGSRTIAGQQIRFVFTNMPSGAAVPVSWLFDLTARVGSGLVSGTSLASRVTVNDTSANNVMMPDQAQTVPLALGAPAISEPAIAFGVAAAVPIAPLPVYVNFTNAGNEAAGQLWINVTLDPSLQFAGSSLPATVSNATVQFVLANVPLGPDAILLRVSALASVVDGQVLGITGTIAATDGYGNVLGTMAAAPGSVLVAIPRLNFTLNPATQAIEAGTLLQYTFTGGNLGSGTASVAYLNVTLPASLGYISDSFGAQLVAVGSNYSWRWPDYAPGGHTYTLNVTATGAAADRTSADFVFTARALDLGGYGQAPSLFRAHVDFLAPAWSLAIVANPAAAPAGGTSNLTVRVQNVGSTAARYLWLLLTLDPHVDLITHTATVPATGTSTLNWTFQDVQPGQSITFNVIVKVAAGTAANTPIAEVLEAHFTNSAGVVLGYARSAPAQIGVQADYAGLVYILLVGSLGGAGVIFLVYRRYRVEIEDVFLIGRDGILISHLTNTAAPGKDEDQLSGMLTAVQDFVQDAFTYGENRELHQLEFGDYHVLLERGKTVYLAVVYAGRDSGLIRKKVRAVLERIESQYGAVFDKWDGDMQDVAGTHDLLREGFLEEERPWSLVKPKGP